MNVINLPVKKRHRRVVRAAEMYAQPECPDQMVWDMCEYTRHKNLEDACKECPRWEEDPDHGKMQRGCFMVAHEACRLALAWKKRIDGEKK